jgi:hypothetical protein
VGLAVVEEQAIHLGSTGKGWGLARGRFTRSH